MRVPRAAALQKGPIFAAQHGKRLTLYYTVFTGMCNSRRPFARAWPAADCPIKNELWPMQIMWKVYTKKAGAMLKNVEKYRTTCFFGGNRL